MAIKAIEKYIADCDCSSADDVACAMMKMTGVAEKMLEGLIGTGQTIRLLTLVVDQMKAGTVKPLKPVFVSKNETKH